MKKTVEQRFWEKVGPHDDPAKCWLWLAFADRDEYGLFWNSKTVRAHRFSYEMHYHVTIPVGMTIDHVKARGCVSTLCVNPHHLEVVTQKVNVLRGDGFAALHIKVTHCPQGHPYGEENTYMWHDMRYCRVCRREQDRKRYLVGKKEVVHA